MTAAADLLVLNDVFSYVRYQAGRQFVFDANGNPIALGAGISVSVYARGDGVNDDAPGINTAAAVAAAAGVPLIFPKPAVSYRALTPIVIPSGADWRGQCGAMIYIDPLMDTSSSPTIGGAKCALYSQGTTDVSLRDLVISSSTVGLTKVLRSVFDGVTNVTLDRCTFKNFGNVGFYVQGLVIFNSSNIEISGNRFTGNSGDGLALSSGCVKYRITGNSFDNNADYGCVATIDCDDGDIVGNVAVNNTQAGIGTDRCNKVAIVGNSISGGVYGILTSTFGSPFTANKTLTYVGNTVVGASGAGISVQTLAANDGVYSITGNVVRDCGRGVLVVDSENGNITGNTVFNSATEAILLESLTVNCGRAIVQGNYINGCTYGVRLLNSGGATTPIMCGPNKILNASVAPTAIATGDYLEADVSANYWDASKPINFPPASSSNAATAGGIASPGNFVGFLKMYINGALVKVPYFNN